MAGDSLQSRLMALYKQLHRRFGPRHWWPGDTPLEVMVGAILTQNTAWTNVEKAIANIKNAKVLHVERILALSHARLAALLRPSGYFNIKTKRLKSFLNFYKDHFGARVAKMKREPLHELRKQLLEVRGVGPETADSILLYALGKPVFVVDAYTKRIFSRLGLISEASDYHQVQDFFMTHLPHETALFNDYHAQIVQLGKEICKKTKPRCAICPVLVYCRYGSKVLKVD